MNVVDCHVHTNEYDVTNKTKGENLIQKMKDAGITEAFLFSAVPASEKNEIAHPGDAKRRIQEVMSYVKGYPQLHPFFHIDPMEPDAGEQVEMAEEAGIEGFKVICCHHFPQDEKAMRIWEKIARTNRPVIFHSGILYNHGPSADYNRPGNFEALFCVKGLRFAMAHVAWPWCDELIAVFGKWEYFQTWKKLSDMAEMFIDLSPGTPASYREETLRKLLTVGYPALPEHLLFGTDCFSTYDDAYAREILAQDNFIYDKLGIPQEIRNQIYSQNAYRFLNGKQQ